MSIVKWVRHEMRRKCGDRRYMVVVSLEEEMGRYWRLSECVILADFRRSIHLEILAKKNVSLRYWMTVEGGIMV